MIYFHAVKIYFHGMKIVFHDANINKFRKLSTSNFQFSIYYRIFALEIMTSA